MIRRHKTLVIYNIWVPAGTETEPSYFNYKTSDDYTSRECADAYAELRGYHGEGDPGEYYRLGVDWHGSSAQYNYNTGISLAALTVAESYAPGQSPATDNTRYTGQSLKTAIRNIVDDNEIDAIFTESLVPCRLDECYYYNSAFKQSPDGWYNALCPSYSRYSWIPSGVRYIASGYITDLYDDTNHVLPNPTSNNWIANNRDMNLPWGRIGWPGCSMADIVRVAEDANWAETQYNFGKFHVIGGTNYGGYAGGNTAYLDRANASFAAKVPSNQLEAFDESTASGSVIANRNISYDDYENGIIDPPFEAFGLLKSRLSNEGPVGGVWYCVSRDSWTPLRGNWIFNWCSSPGVVGYDALTRGGTAAIICEIEPYTDALPATDCVAECLVRGLSVAEANFLSGRAGRGPTSVYGAPDYVPYAIQTSGDDEMTLVNGTDANTTMAAGNLYAVNVGAFTADRNYTLPASPTVGDLVGVMVTVGDDTYECVLKGNTGQYVNGIGTAVEWSRVFITGEVVKFRYTSSNNWVVEHDGRIAMKALLSLTTSPTADEAAQSGSIITFQTPTSKSGVFTADTDIGNITIVGSSRIKPRRDCKGSFSIAGVSGNQISAANRFTVRINKNSGAGYPVQVVFAPAVQTFPDLMGHVESVSITRDDTFDYEYGSDEGSKGLYSFSAPTTRTHMAFTEVF